MGAEDWHGDTPNGGVLRSFITPWYVGIGQLSVATLDFDLTLRGLRGFRNLINQSFTGDLLSRSARQWHPGRMLCTKVDVLPLCRLTPDSHIVPAPKENPANSPDCPT